jgi:hypothetical protein
MHFCPTWLLRKVFTALTISASRSTALTNTKQGLRKQKYRMGKERQVPGSENSKNCTRIELSKEKRISEVHRKEQIPYISSC